MPGPVERSMRAGFTSGSTLRTFGRGAQFGVGEIDDRGIVLKLGQQQAHTRLSWECLEGAADFLRGRGWVRVGGARTAEGERGTLDEYLKRHIKRDTARWVARVLAEAGVVEVDRRPPLRVRLAGGIQEAR